MSKAKTSQSNFVGANDLTITSSTTMARWCSATPAIVSKRNGSPYRSGRSPDWRKIKNPACEAVTEAEEDWGR
jgi:hypothetical protein